VKSKEQKEKNEQIVLSVLTWMPFHNDPPNEWHAAVMINMKKTDLFVLLAKNEKYL
jgi:phage terminase large subunit-like protein